MLISIILIIIGIFVALKPYIAWYVYIGWQIKDSEPTDSSLTIYRLLAVLKILIGFIMIFNGSFSN